MSLGTPAQSVWHLLGRIEQLAVAEEWSASTRCAMISEQIRLYQQQARRLDDDESQI